MTFDLILLVLLLLSAWKGWRSGALSMLLSVAILILAAIFASELAHRVGDVVRVGSEWFRPIVGFAISFLVLLIAGNWLTRLIRPKHGFLRGLDGLVGGVLGLLRGALLLGLLLALIALVHLPPERTTQDSTLYPILLEFAGTIFGVLKPYIHAASRHSGIAV